jgi:hypothetical protein
MNKEQEFIKIDKIRDILEKNIGMEHYKSISMSILILRELKEIKKDD